MVLTALILVQSEDFPVLGGEIHGVEKLGSHPLGAQQRLVTPPPVHPGMVAGEQHLGHIQTAAVPERHEPGTGEVDDDRIFRLIDTLGYPGYIGGEYNPAGATVAGLGWLRLGGER